jgi:hypothetical protein
MPSLSPISKSFIALVVISGAAILAYEFAHWQTLALAEFAALSLVSAVASRLRVKLPGVTGTMSVNLPFILIAVAALSVSEALLVACVSTFVQSLPRTAKKINFVQTVFNVSNMALAVAATRFLYGSAAIRGLVASHPLLLAIAAGGFLVVNTVPVAIIIALTEHTSAMQTWFGMLQLSFVYYVACAGIAGVAITVSARIGWQLPVAILPLMLGIFWSYRRFFSTSQALSRAHAAN